MRKDRLEKLAAFLDNLKPECFDIRSVSNRCGTVCCAIGWMAEVDPKYWRRYQHDIFPVGMAAENWEDGAEEYFEIERAIVAHIFSPSHYSTPQVLPTEVAKRIRTCML